MITPTQYQQLMALLQNSGFVGASPDDKPIWANLSHSSPTYFSDSVFGTSFIFSVSSTINSLNSHSAPLIIDSRATDHVASSLDYFHT
jgi:hypothetical protein